MARIHRYDSMALADSQAVFAGGQKLRFHRAVLSLQSAPLHQWISANLEKLADVCLSCVCATCVFFSSLSTLPLCLYVFFLPLERETTTC